MSNLTTTRPPGFFGHRQAFSSEGIYGQWLMEKPLMVVVNGNAFVHGGMPPLVTGLGLSGLNEILGSQVSDYVAQIDVLNEAGLLDPAMSFYKHAELVKSLRSVTSLSEEIRNALHTIIDLNDSSVHGDKSPLWYRGTGGMQRAYRRRSPWRRTAGGRRRASCHRAHAQRRPGRCFRGMMVVSLRSIPECSNRRIAARAMR